MELSHRQQAVKDTWINTDLNILTKARDRDWEKNSDCTS